MTKPTMKYKNRRVLMIRIEGNGDEGVVFTTPKDGSFLFNVYLVLEPSEDPSGAIFAGKLTFARDGRTRFLPYAEDRDNPLHPPVI